MVLLCPPGAVDAKRARPGGRALCTGLQQFFQSRSAAPSERASTGSTGGGATGRGGSLWAGPAAGALRFCPGGGSRRAAGHRPEFDRTVRGCLEELQALERENCPSLDRTADTFARLLAGAAPASGDAARDRALGQLLYHVGRWIYLVDAWDDLEEDRRAGSYNPISARFGGETEANRDYLRTTLRHSLNLARSAAALLELGHWRETVENILFLGLPMVEELVFTGRWKAVNQHNRRQNP